MIFGGLSGAGDLPARNARNCGGKSGILYGEQRFSWREFNARACRCANALAGLGVRRGDRVAICAANSHRWVEALFGLAKLGAVLVTVNNRLAAREIAHILEDSGAQAVFTGAAEEERVREASGSCSALSLGVSLDDIQEGGELLDYETLLGDALEGEPSLERPLRWEDPLMLLYTSGTTGFPKGAVYTHGSTLCGMFIHVHAIGSRGTHRVLLPAPLYSAAGMAGIYCAVYVGSTSVIMNFDAQQVPAAIARERISFTNLVPTTIQRLLSEDTLARYELSSLELLLYGGAPIPIPVLRAAHRLLPGCSFRQTFAATETGCAGTVLEPRDHQEALEDAACAGRLLSCGQAQVNVDVAVMNDAGQPLPAGEVGEIGVRSEGNIQGFWNNPEAERETLRDGWVFTGDMARMDEDGYYYLVDRKKDLILSGALNVYPSEVERVLYEHPAVYEAAVIGVPSQEWGEEVKAVMVVKPGHTLEEREIIGFCRERMAGFKTPKSVEFKDALPRNPTGKILRRQLRDAYWQGRARKIG